MPYDLFAPSLDDEGREHRASKLPSNEEMMQVAALFCEAPNLDLETEFYTAVMALLMVAPGRASELFSLSTDCLVWEDDSAGVKRLGIRWNPAKNGKAGLKVTVHRQGLDAHNSEGMG